MSNKLKRMMGNFIYLLMGDSLAKLVGFCSIAWLARHYGAEEFGKIGFAEAFYGYFIYVGIAGVDIIATREVSQKPEDSENYLSNLIVFKIVLSVIAFVILSIVVYFSSVPQELKSITLMFGFCLFPLGLSIEWFYQAVEKMRYIGLFRILREVCYITGVGILISLNSNIKYIPIIRTTAMLIGVLYLMKSIHKIGYTINIVLSKIDCRLWWSILKQSSSILLSQLLIILMYNFSIIYMGMLNKTAEVGYFTAVQKIILFFMGMAGIFWMAVFPNISRLCLESKENLAVFEERLTKVICIFSIPIGFVFFSLADKFIFLFYGESFANSITILRILIWVAIGAFLIGIHAQGLLASGKQKSFFITVFIQAAVSLLLVFILVPRYGAIGASFSWLIAEVVGFFVYKRFYMGFVRFDFYKYLIKPIFASLVMVFFLKLVNLNNVIIASMFAFMVYFITLFFISGVNRNEISFIYASVFDRI